MMPKGVEHMYTAPDVPNRYKVKIPMMPKGVEHEMAITANLVQIMGEDSNDAERR